MGSQTINLPELVPFSIVQCYENCETAIKSSERCNCMKSFLDKRIVLILPHWRVHFQTLRLCEKLSHSNSHIFLLTDIFLNDTSTTWSSNVYQRALHMRTGCAAIGLTFEGSSSDDVRPVGQTRPKLSTTVTLLASRVAGVKCLYMIRMHCLAVPF